MPMINLGTFKQATRILLSTVSLLFFTTGKMTVAEDHPPFAITISAAQPQFRLGEAIPLTISLKNVSEHDIKITQVVAEKQAQLDYSIAVTDPSGVAVKSRKGALMMPGDGSIAIINLQPGEQHPEYVSIDALFDIKQPGSYKVQVRRDIPMYLGEGQVKSNILTITISQ